MFKNSARHCTKVFLLQTHAKVYYDIINRQNVNKKDLKDGVPILQGFRGFIPF
jgi:hypothetical protein